MAVVETPGRVWLDLSKARVDWYVEATGEADPLEAVRKGTGRDAVWIRPPESIMVSAEVPPEEIARELDRFSGPARESILACHAEYEADARAPIPLARTAAGFEELAPAEAFRYFYDGPVPYEDLDAVLAEASRGACERLSNGNYLLKHA
jgi:hypothetical protein